MSFHFASHRVRIRYLLTLNVLKCLGNANGTFQEDRAPNPLTDLGRQQAESLGKQWEDARIDHLFSSPLHRAHDTAKALSDLNEGHPEIIIRDDLVERRFGAKLAHLKELGHRFAREFREELTGHPYNHPGPYSRSHSPAEGGESLNGVAHRAGLAIREFLIRYGVNLSSPPELFTRKETTGSPAVLPDGIPHVVIVSHNLFLVELYEKLHTWGKEHQLTNCDYSNAGW